MYRRFLSVLAAAALRDLSDKVAGDQKRYDRYERKVRSQADGWLYHPNGHRECARRCAQINAGQLREANGLTP